MNLGGKNMLCNHDYRLTFSIRMLYTQGVPNIITFYMYITLKVYHRTRYAAPLLLEQGGIDI